MLVREDTTNSNCISILSYGTLGLHLSVRYNILIINQVNNLT